MLKWYGYLGLLMILLVQANFLVKLEPFAEWYIPIVWYGYILFVDSLVHMIKGRSLISSRFSEFVFMCALSLPFWLIFEMYNIFTVSWIYMNYEWYVHLFDFTTIMPAVLETFMLFRALGIGEGMDVTKELRKRAARGFVHMTAMGSLIAIGTVAVLVPLIIPILGFPFMWFGLFLLLDPLSYVSGRPSLIHKFGIGQRSILLQLFCAGIVMGFFWEFWNFMAIPKWVYNLPMYAVPGIKLFEMPLLGYLGYLPFAAETFLFYSFFRSFVFKSSNDLLAI